MRESWTKLVVCATSEEQIPVQSIDRFDGRGDREKLFNLLSWSCAACQLVVLMSVRLRRPTHAVNKFFLFPRGSPCLLRPMINSSGVRVGARTAVFTPPASDMRFELSPVPPNPLGEGRWIKTAAALVIGCVVCRGWSLFTKLAE